MWNSRNTTSKGILGEDIAQRYLISKGYEIIERNHLKRYGEIDIVAKKNGRVVFVEVKTLFYDAVPRETTYLRPEENFTPSKFHKLKRVISVYVEKHNIHEFDVLLLAVEVDRTRRVAKVRDTMIF